MQIGTVFPTAQIGTDPAVIEEYVRTMESLGYDHTQGYDHVLGADPDRPGWEGEYDYRTPFHEPLTLFGHLAAVTDTIDLITGILILPQRQTVLVAKQAAEVDVLSEGRLRLGVAVGWNPVEYEALGMDFDSRDERIEEQIEVLRELWENDLVSYTGEYHEVTDAGINPLPDQRPIPIWMGGDSDAVLRRTARLADGWLAQDEPPEYNEAKIARLREYIEAEGRDPGDVTFQARFEPDPDDPEGWADAVLEWRDLGFDRLSLDTMEMDLDDPEAHIEALGRFKDRMDDAGIDLG